MNTDSKQNQWMNNMTFGVYHLPEGTGMNNVAFGNYIGHKLTDNVLKRIGLWWWVLAHERGE